MVSGVEGIASPDDSSGQQTGEPADAPAAPCVIEEAPAVRQTWAKRVLVHMRPVLRVACCIGAVVCVASGIWLFMRQPQADPTAARSRAVQEQAVPAEDLQPILPEPSPPATDDHSAWEARLREIDALRQTLLAKKRKFCSCSRITTTGFSRLKRKLRA